MARQAALGGDPYQTAAVLVDLLHCVAGQTVELRQGLENSAIVAADAPTVRGKPHVVPVVLHDRDHVTVGQAIGRSEEPRSPTVVV